MTKAEIYNLFESSGFSLQSQAQYQIVQQGKINSLIQGEDESFMTMLKDVTGTATFDTRLAKLQDVLKDTKTKKEDMVKNMETINEKLQHLSRETEDFKEMQRLENTKRAFELAIFENKIKFNNEQLQTLMQQKQKAISERNTLKETKEMQQSSEADQMVRL